MKDSTQAQSLIIDCDPGHDDMTAIIVAHHYARVKGITTVSGNAPLVSTTSNALMATALLHVDTPIHAGASEPLNGEAVHAGYVHGQDGLAGVTRIEHAKTVASDNAVEYLLDSATSDDWIVAVGPLTNIAMAVRQDPSWTHRIRGISIMGGSTTAGNVTPVAEFNVYADPEAAAEVFNSGAKLRMCGLNLTHQFMTTDSTVETISALNTDVAKFAEESFTFLLERMENLGRSREAPLHDPCAVFAITHPEIFRFESLSVDVELNGELTRGMTVADQRKMSGRSTSNVEVAQEIDSTKAMKLLLQSLN